MCSTLLAGRSISQSRWLSERELRWSARRGRTKALGISMVRVILEPSINQSIIIMKRVILKSSINHSINPSQAW